MKWLDFDPKRQEHAAELLSNVRFETIPASELVSEIQPVARMMLDPQCHRLLVEAMNYHLLPYQQNTLQSRRTKVRGSQSALLTIGGRPSLTERALSREVNISPCQCSREERWNNIGPHCQSWPIQIDRKSYKHGRRLP